LINLLEYLGKLAFLNLIRKCLCTWQLLRFFEKNHSQGDSVGQASDTEKQLKELWLFSRVAKR